MAIELLNYLSITFAAYILSLATFTEKKSVQFFIFLSPENVLWELSITIKYNAYTVKLKLIIAPYIFSCTKWHFCASELVHMLVCWACDEIKMSHWIFIKVRVVTKKEGFPFRELTTLFYRLGDWNTERLGNFLNSPHYYNGKAENGMLA